MFGPFLVKDGRKQRKYYGAIFAYMSSRAVHIETANSMSIDSFKLASTLSQIGNVRMIHTDNGTNFLGTSIELRKAFTVMNYTKINNFLMELGGEWITWRQILPMTSNMVGVWKHQICSAQNILNSLNNEFSIFRAEQMWRKLRTYGERLNTAKPVYSDHLEDEVSVVFIGRWLL